MFRSILIFFLTLSVFCSAELRDPAVLAATDGDPQTTISQHVNALTGDFVLFQDDYVVPGVEPLPLRRYYVSGGGRESSSCEFFPQTKLFVEYETAKTPLAYVGQSSGGVLTYKLKKKKKKSHDLIFYPDLKDHGKGVTNTAHGLISARNNFKNSRLEKRTNSTYVLYCADGAERLYRKKKMEADYKRYLLYNELLPNKNRVFYEYDEKERLTLIKTTNPSTSKTYAWARFRYFDKEGSLDFNIETSDGKLLEYRFGLSGNEYKGFVTYLKSIKTPERPDETIEYSKKKAHSGRLLKKRIFPEGREIYAEYYKEGTNENLGRKVKIRNEEDPRFDSVRILYEQAGPDGELIPAQHFFYHISREKKHGRYQYIKDGLTEVIDAQGCKTLFHFSSSFYPTSIEKYDEKGEHHQTVQMAWNEQGEIQRKTVLGADRKEIWTREFSYDGAGNVVEERFCGDLCGKGSRESYRKRMRYAHDHLPVRIEEDSGAVTLYTYLPGRPFITSQFQCDGEKILTRQFHEYDADNLLIRTICDDGDSPDQGNLSGATYRKITLIERRQEAPALGFPQVVEERYLELASAQERLLKRCVFTYQTNGKLSRREIFDADGHFCYALHTQYDAKGRPCEESNPLGQVQKTRYNCFGNPVYQESYSGQLATELTYDRANRLRMSKEMGADSQVHTNHFSYDSKGRKTAAIDLFGHTTRFIHNPIGSLVETRFPEAEQCAAKTHVTFDGAGREVSKIDERGDETKTTYNAYHKPTRILYADGAKEQFFYNPNGTLAEKIDQRSTLTAFTYDVLGREVEKRIYDDKRTLLMSETSEYKGELLVKHTDPIGHSVCYFYDGAGRKIAQEDEMQRIEYAYDALGRMRLTSTSDGSATLRTFKEYDFLERLIEERCEDESGQLLTRVAYAYDASGNRSCITRSIDGQVSQEHLVYDAFNRLISHVDASGHATLTQYDEQHPTLRKITRDPRGVNTCETFDPLGRLASAEKMNAHGDLVSLERFTYDPSGKLCRQEGHLVSQGRTTSTVETLWKYGVLGRLLSMTEAAKTPDQRTTSYTYDAGGLLQEIIKPDGVVLRHAYDALGRKTRLTSSDGSIDYGYTYDALGRTTELENLLTHKVTAREYDQRGCFLSETFETALSVSRSFDPMARRTSLHFNDGSAALYKYDALFLRSVTRISSNGTPLYAHRYHTYDESGNLLQEELAGDLGPQTRKLDVQGRTVLLESPYFHHVIEAFDAVGNILQMTKAGEARAFAYDSLSQLEAEKDHTYVYDSHNNRRQQDSDAHLLNGLNELLKTREAIFTYNVNGSPTSMQTREGIVYYRYDALDRLIEVEEPHVYRLVFNYDGFHRRSCKTRYIWQADRWVEEEWRYFLYDDQNEIGAVNASGEIAELRILGLTPRAEAGSAIAIELEGKTYVPQHDIMGNLVALVSPETRAVVETYDFTAFGEEKSNTAQLSQPLSPWRYLSKRVDAETHLVYFGRRYYMPSLGRWLTTDPKGYTALSSLYAFCSNNPLTHFDLYGLEDLIEREKEERSFFSTFCSAIESFAHRVCSYFTESSDNYKIEAAEQENCGIGYINGIRTTYTDAMMHAQMLSDLARGTSINLTHSASHSGLVDVPICMWGQCGGSTPAMDLMRKNWDDFFEKAAPDAKYLQICTSGGCIELYNLLEKSPKEVRERIRVLAISPGRIIPNEICFRSENFISRRDFVTKLDLVGQAKYGDQIFMLEPHKDAPFHDHSIMSPTFREIIQNRMELHIQNPRGKQ